MQLSQYLKLVAGEAFDLLVSANFLVGLGLNLTNALASHVELFSYFFKSPLNTVFETVPQFQNLSFLRRKVVQNLSDLVLNLILTVIGLVH